MLLQQSNQQQSNHPGKRKKRNKLKLLKLMQAIPEGTQGQDSSSPSDTDPSPSPGSQDRSEAGTANSSGPSSDPNESRVHPVNDPDLLVPSPCTAMARSDPDGINSTVSETPYLADVSSSESSSDSAKIGQLIERKLREIERRRFGGETEEIWVDNKIGLGLRGLENQINIMQSKNGEMEEKLLREVKNQISLGLKEMENRVVERLQTSNRSGPSAGCFSW